MIASVLKYSNEESLLKIKEATEKNIQTLSDMINNSMSDLNLINIELERRKSIQINNNNSKQTTQ